MSEPLKLMAMLLLSVVTAVQLHAASVDFSKIPPAATHAVDFAKEVQPLLAERCYGCHGPKKQESGLRLDDKTAALKGGETGAAIVPGKGVESLLVQAIAQARDDIKMPKKGDRLTAEQVGLLRAWIDQGAKWPDAAVAGKKDFKNHWAFKAPIKPAVPSVKKASWVRTPVDAFVLTQLQKEGMQPSLEADKVTLLRRLSLDLIGLPPTPKEVDAFLADRSPDAWKKQVDRLLASPHYGERWGRHWLDATRYADSDGFEKDKRRFIWAYRDYVINAFNRDLPYNQFVIEQLAGDQLPNPSQDQIVATGFLRNSMINEEGGVDPEQFRMDEMFDRMDCIGKSVLGLTIQCAQCHTHKFDPLTHEEYYRMFSFLNNDHEAQRSVYAADELAKIESIRRQTTGIEDDLKHRTPDWENRMAAWEESVSKNLPQWTPLHLAVEEISTGGQRNLPMEDESLLAQGYAPTKHTVRLDAKTTLTNITAIRLEALTDPNLPMNGPGRSLRGTFGLTEFKMEFGSPEKTNARTKVVFSRATSDYDQTEKKLEPDFYDKSTNNRVIGPIAYAIDGNDYTAWGIDSGPGRRNQDRKAVFQLATNLALSKDTGLTFRITQNHGGWNSDELMNNNLGRYRISVTDAPGRIEADPVPKRVREMMSIKRDERTAAQQSSVFAYWRTQVPEFSAANARIAALWDSYPEGNSSLVLMSRDQPRETHMLKRGDFLKPMKSVTPGTPAFLHSLPENAPGTRLTFAKWLVDKQSPTPARVFVNRMWQTYFGTGLVSTPEDFGMQSDAPSNQALLDWLACEFMDSGWSVKQMHRLIVNSATYRQSSRVTPESFEKDPNNRFAARGPRFRVEGEIVRDIQLAASGLLNDKVGGRSVMPEAPSYLFLPPVSYAPFEWTVEKDDNRYRRALYTFRRRSTPYPMLQTFDVPNADVACVRRSRSNTPLQALMSLNETVSLEAARALAVRALKEGGKSDAERIIYAFRLCLARKPQLDEQKELLEFLNKEQVRFADGWLEPAKLLGVTNSAALKLPEGIKPTQLAAWTAVSRVLLNLDETITKE